MRTLYGIIAAALIASAAFAQNSPPSAPQRIKGTIESFAAPTLTVKTTDGKTLAITMTPDAKIIANEKSSLKDIKPNDFVASAAVTGPDGKLHSQEVRIFPDALRGLGEGQYPMDTPNRSMTNATVEQVAGAANAKGGTLKLTFHGSTAGANGSCSGHATAPGKGNCVGQTELVVGPNVPVMKWVLGEPGWLEKGKAVSLFAVAGPDGKLVTHGVVVEHNGIKPLL
jgi:hypothetical protein